ncbi:MAG TPA: hypothetical protein VFU98_08935, partial [Microlunatus sp.]|nr:hypothetical protein [Microlunatus sp.]
LRTEEVARLGQTLLDGGRWRGRQLVPPDVVAGLTADAVDTLGHRATDAAGPHPDNALYGRHIWLCARDQAWRMDGIHGQLAVIMPDQQSCITVTAHYTGPTTDVLDAVWAEIVPVLS